MHERSRSIRKRTGSIRPLRAGCEAASACVAGCFSRATETIVPGTLKLLVYGLAEAARQKRKKKKEALTEAHRRETHCAFKEFPHAPQDGYQLSEM